MTLAIWWIRRDLRLGDNPALSAALRHHKVIPLYIHAPEEEGAAAPGAASRWWLHHGLQALDAQLRGMGSRLVVREGRSALSVLEAITRETSAEAVYWNRQYAPTQIERDKGVKAALRGKGIHAESFNAALLFEPWVIEREGKPYRVFTPYWNACLKHGIDQPVLPSPVVMPQIPSSIQDLPLGTLGLLPKIPWALGLEERWSPGEAAAWKKLERFLDQALEGYKTHRDRPGIEGTTRLSPHLHFGEIGPRQVVRTVMSRLGGVINADAAHFFSELGWREFSHHLLFHFPHTVDHPMDRRWNAFPWPAVDPRLWQAWITGCTGIPLVDAGMRELWHTGWMHNRVRMNAASLLVKNMLIPWQEGERWFWDTLVDADLANNIQGWQWTAGCGADAAPYFRIFNPGLQGERFDGSGEYVRRWLPELVSLPDRWLHRPWAAPANVLCDAGLRLGEHYPHPVVDLGESRSRALASFAQLKATKINLT
ncbi:MAG: deoxyribodipyrimidine photo-lyase [Pseudomonadota bacterium]